MKKFVRMFVSGTLILLLIITGVPVVAFGQPEEKDPLTMMVDMTPDLTPIEEMIQAEYFPEIDFNEISSLNSEDILRTDKNLKEFKNDDQAIREDKCEKIKEQELNDLLEQREKMIDDAKTDRFIVKYKKNREDNFKEKAADAIKKCYESKKPIPAKEKKKDEKTSDHNFLQTLETMASETLDKFDWTSENTDQTELIILNEKVNPSKFAETLKEKNIEDDILYIQPDFKMDLQGVEESYLTPGAVTETEPTPESVTETESTPEAITTTDQAIDAETEDLENSDSGNSENQKIENESEITSESLSDTDEAIDLIIEEQKNKVVVGIIDTGLDITHPELAPYIYVNSNEIADNGIDDDGNGYIDDVNGWNFPDNSGTVYDASLGLEQAHATHIAGIIAGASDADENLVPDDNIAILPLKVFSNGTAYTSDIIAAIEYAESMGAKVVNCSFGSTYGNPALKEAMENSHALFITAAGNARQNLDETPVYPAAFDLSNNLSVTSVNQDGGLSYFSDYGEHTVQIAALGRDIESTLPFGERGIYTGTSMSAGIISAAAGRIFSLGSSLDAAQVKNRLISGADKISSLQGKVNAAARLNIVESLAGSIQTEIQDIIYNKDFDVSGYENVTEALRLFTASETVKVIAGHEHSLALKADGTVWAWGRNSVGECGVGKSSLNETLTQVIGLSNIINIDSQGMSSYALKNDGTVWAWGQNSYGQLGDGTTLFKPAPVQISGLTDIAELSAGYHHCLALKNDGTVWAWGRNTYGQLGDGTSTNKLTPVQVSNLTGITGVTAGYYHSLVIKSDGTVWSWGDNIYGGLGDGTTTNRTTPVQVNGLTDITDLSAGAYHSLARKNDGTAWAWGSNFYGQLGDGTNTRKYVATLLSGISNVKAISSGAYHNFAIKEDNTLWSWGYNNYGQLGDGTTNNGLTPIQLSDISNVDDISAGGSHTLALKTDGTVWAWGYNETGQIGDNSVFDVKWPSETNLFVDMSKIACGFYHTIGLKTNGTVWALGKNDNGQLGDGTVINRTSMVQVNGLEGVEDISVFSTFNIALKTNGTVWTWGDNAYGQLGDGTTTDRSSPVQVGGIADVKAISAGGNFCLALKTDGTVWAWGNNNYGQLGDGTTTNRITPVQVSGLTSVTSIVTGNVHSYAVKSDGTVWAWGRNLEAQLGDGTLVNKTAPVMINGISDIKKIDAGAVTGYLLKNDGTVFSWGHNALGQLGDGTTTNRTTPVQVSGISDAETISAGGRSCFALKTDGTVWAWGRNCSGQLGDGTTDNRLLPARIKNLIDVNQIFTGSNSCLIRSDEGDFVLGDNTFGRLGFPFTEYYTTPIQSWTAISDDHGDTFDTATALDNANGVVTIEGIINHVSDADVFSFTANETASYPVSFGDTTTGSIEAILYDENETMIGNVQSGIDIDLVQGQTYYVKVEHGSIQSSFVEIPYSIQIGTTDKTIVFNCIDGKDIYVPFRVHDIRDFNNLVFTLKYNADDLDLIDLASQTKALEAAAGTVTGSSIVILSYTPGEITFRVNKGISEEKTWSGVINVIKFRAKITGETSIEAGYN